MRRDCQEEQHILFARELLQRSRLRSATVARSGWLQRSGIGKKTSPFCGAGGYSRTRAVTGDAAFTSGAAVQQFKHSTPHNHAHNLLPSQHTRATTPPRQRPSTPQPRATCTCRGHIHPDAETATNPPRPHLTSPRHAPPRRVARPGYQRRAIRSPCERKRGAFRFGGNRA